MSTSAARTSSPLVTIVCSECGVGNYSPLTFTTHTGHIYFRSTYACECGSEVTLADILPNLDDGEFCSTDARGHLAIVTADVIPF